jgi:cytochrome b561
MSHETHGAGLATRGDEREVSHDAIAYLVYFAVGLHIVATIWHAAVKKDETLSRMWRGAGSRASRAGDARSSKG